MYISSQGSLLILVPLCILLFSVNHIPWFYSTAYKNTCKEPYTNIILIKNITILHNTIDKACQLITGFVLIINRSCQVKYFFQRRCHGLLDFMLKKWRGKNEFGHRRSNVGRTRMSERNSTKWKKKMVR